MIQKAASTTVDLHSDLADRINESHRLATAAATTALAHARHAGELLEQAKTQVPHGEWRTWLAENFDGSERTAQRYMRLAKHGGELESKAPRMADLTLSAAEQLLAESRPKPVSISREQYNAYRLLPDIHGVAYDDLKVLIRHYGVRSPLILDEHGNLIDGHQRFRAWQELTRDGHTIDLPTVTRDGLTEPEKHDLIYTSNLLRLNVSERDYEAVMIGWSAASEALRFVPDPMPMELALDTYFILPNVVRRHFTPQTLAAQVRSMAPHLTDSTRTLALANADKIDAALASDPNAAPWVRTFEDPFFMVTTAGRILSARGASIPDA